MNWEAFWITLMFIAAVPVATFGTFALAGAFIAMWRWTVKGRIFNGEYWDYTYSVPRIIIVLCAISVLLALLVGAIV